MKCWSLLDHRKTSFKGRCCGLKEFKWGSDVCVGGRRGREHLWIPWRTHHANYLQTWMSELRLNWYQSKLFDQAGGSNLAHTNLEHLQTKVWVEHQGCGREGNKTLTSTTHSSVEYYLFNSVFTMTLVSCYPTEQSLKSIDAILCMFYSKNAKYIYISRYLQLTDNFAGVTPSGWYCMYSIQKTITVVLHVKLTDVHACTYLDCFWYILRILHILLKQTTLLIISVNDWPMK